MAAKRTKPPNAGKGRKKGVLNRVTRSVRQAFEAVFLDCQSDPKHPSNLANFARAHPKEFVAACSRLIPTEIKADVAHRIVPDVALTLRAMITPRSE